MKNIFLLSFALFALLHVSEAQIKPELINENERDACFLYAEGESPFNKNCKILIVSGYIHRQKYRKLSVSEKLGTASASYYSSLLNAFNKKIDKIASNEILTDHQGIYKIILRAQKVESYKPQSNPYVQGFCPTDIKNDPILTSSTRTFSKDCRNRFIQEKRKAGYHVFQVTFEDYYQREMSSIFSVNDFAAVVDEVEKLSALEVDVYYPGSINSLADYRASKSEKTTSKKTPTKATEKDTPLTAESRIYRAAILEAEGDKYAKSSSTTMEALERYRASYNMWPTPSVAKKIQDIESMMGLATGIIKGGKALGKGVDKINDNFQPFTEFDFSFAPIGLGLGASGGGVAWRTGAILYMKVGLAYQKSGTFGAEIYEDKKNAQKLGSISNLRFTNYTFEIGPGINIPISSNYHFRLESTATVGGATLLGLDSYKIDPKSVTMYTLAAGAQFTYRLPNKKLALGLYYRNLGVGFSDKGSLNEINHELTGYRLSTGESHSLHYSANAPKRYSLLGISVIIRNNYK